MCGIAGIIQYQSRNFSTDHLQKMTDALAHRGPDGEGFWKNEEGSVLLGHRRLSIIDLSDAGKQPMPYLDRYTIIHNGEIYNYIELREELRKAGYAFQSLTDTEVIAAAYDRWKEDCLEKLDGMFAFAIWDEKDHILFAARDRFGEKPFFYALRDGVLCFASEMKALWAAGIARLPNLKLLFNFITIGYVDNPEIPGETFFEKIDKLPPASYLKFIPASGEFKIFNYWDLDLHREDLKISDAEATARFTELLTLSVKRRMRSDVPIGTSLSGGLDSSSVAAISSALQSPQQSYKSFTAVFDNGPKNEFAYAHLVAEEYKLQPYYSKIILKELLDQWDNFCFHQEEPVGSSSAFAQFKVFESAKQNSVKVLLDGQGADEILAGYHKYYKWFWQELFRKGKLRRSGELDAARSLGINEPFTIRNKIASWFPNFASIVMDRQYLLKAIRHEDLTKEFIRLQSKEAYYTPPEYFNLNGLLYFNVRTHGLEELLRCADRNSMAHGNEVRLPFLSHELVEFLFTLPASFKIRQGWTKWLLRESMKSRLPGKICWRKDKVAFEPPQNKWMEDPSLKEAIREAKRLLVKEQILKPSVLRKDIRALEAYAPDNYDWRYFSAAALFK